MTSSHNQWRCIAILVVCLRSILILPSRHLLAPIQEYRWWFWTSDHWELSVLSRQCIADVRAGTRPLNVASQCCFCILACVHPHIEEAQIPGKMVGHLQCGLSNITLFSWDGLFESRFPVWFDHKYISIDSYYEFGGISRMPSTFLMYQCITSRAFQLPSTSSKTFFDSRWTPSRKGQCIAIPKEFREIVERMRGAFGGFSEIGAAMRPLRMAPRQIAERLQWEC